MSLLYSYVRQYKKTLLGALLLAAINQIFSLLDPQVFRLLIDNYATKIDQLSSAEFAQGVLLLLLLSMSVAFISRVAKNFQDYYVNVVTQRVGARLYTHSVGHSFSLPFAVFEDQRSGQLLQNLHKARTDSQNLISSFINIVFLSAVGMVFVIAYAFWVNWLIGLIYFSVLPVVGFTTFYITRKVKAIQTKIVLKTADLAGSTTETLRNVELVKSLGLESQETQRLNDVTDKILALELEKVKLVRKLSFIQGTMINAVRSAIMFVMLWLVFQKAISIGQFFSLLFYSFAIFEPLGQLGTFSSLYQEARASMEVLQGILNMKPEEKPANAVVLGPIEHIKFDNVSFKYNESTNPSAEGVTFEIKNGQNIAFVGPSGSGKSTLLKLLVGLYKPQQGQISINGVDGSNIDYDDIRRRIGYVSQETQLFAGTIRENLLFVNPHATDEECLKALNQAAVQNIVERGGQGLDTKIGEGGVKISGGERQRLAIARALLRNPEIIIFDEATSSLDSITERSITETIKDIAKSYPNLITIQVAHRLSTVFHADKLYVLQQGKIVEMGNHGELITKQGLYSALWREQGGEIAQA